MPMQVPERTILLITDQLAAPADFILHRVLAARLKRGPEPVQALILSVSEDVARWRALASKANVNLQSVVFLNLLDGVLITAAFDRIRDLLKQHASTNTLVILDDISTLSWIGLVPPQSLRHFVRALRAVCIKSQATLIIRQHFHHPEGDGDGDDDALFRLLLQISTHHLEVRPLASGRSGSVSGEISLHPGFSSNDLSSSTSILSNLITSSSSAESSSSSFNIPIGRSAAVQYRLTDSGPVFFARGTSAGVM